MLDFFFLLSSFIPMYENAKDSYPVWLEPQRLSLPLCSLTGGRQDLQFPEDSLFKFQTVPFPSQSRHLGGEFLSFDLVDLTCKLLLIRFKGQLLEINELPVSCACAASGGEQLSPLETGLQTGSPKPGATYCHVPVFVWVEKVTSEGKSFWTMWKSAIFIM